MLRLLLFLVSSLFPSSFLILKLTISSLTIKEAKSNFQHLQKIYSVLSDPTKRSDYDKYGEETEENDNDDADDVEEVNDEGYVPYTYEQFQELFRKTNMSDERK
jgi:DnaJ-class molecular chaperone